MKRHRKLCSSVVARTRLLLFVCSRVHLFAPARTLSLPTRILATRIDRMACERQVDDKYKRASVRGCKP